MDISPLLYVLQFEIDLSSASVKHQGVISFEKGHERKLYKKSVTFWGRLGTR